MKLKSGISLQEIFFFLLLISLTVAFFNIIAPFIADIFLTIILVILFKKPFAFLKRKFKNKDRIAAGVTITLVLLTIIIPLFFIGLLITKEVAQIYTLAEQQWPAFQDELLSGNFQERLRDIPLIGDKVDQFNIENYRDKINETVGNVTQIVIVYIQGTFKGIMYMLIHTFIILFLMYFVLLDGKTLIKRLQYLIPLNDNDEKQLFDNIERVTDAIVFNSFMLGIIEGTFGGILFAILGVPSPVFWGFIMTFLSIIPVVGTNSVLIPVALFHFIIGDYTTGTLILVIGTGAVTINQNIIRPRLDGDKSGMHTAVALLASLGGLMWMGIIGFLAGPLLMALFIAVWNLYGVRYQTKLDEFNNNDNIQT